MGEYLSSPEGKHIFLNGAHTKKILTIRKTCYIGLH